MISALGRWRRQEDTEIKVILRYRGRLKPTWTRDPDAEKKVRKGRGRNGGKEKGRERKKAKKGKGEKLCPYVCSHIPFALETKFKFILLAS